MEGVGTRTNSGKQGGASSVNQESSGSRSRALAGGGGAVDAASDTVSPPGNSPGSALVIAGSRPAEAVEFDRAMVSFFVGAAEMLGVPKSVAAIYGICFASPEPLTFSEIQERLDISAGSISQGLRVLREVGALKVSDVLPASPAPRPREYFEPDLELRKLVSHFIEQRLDRQLDSGRSALRTIAQRVPGGTESAKVLRARLQSLQTWHDRARAVLPLVRGFLKLA